MPQFKTGDAALTGRVWFNVQMPNAVWYWAEVLDALNLMCLSDNWEQVGTVSVENAVENAEIMVEYFGPQVGAILPIITATPANCLDCDGSSYNRVDYPKLYAALDAAFVIDADTFFVPDLRGRTLIGTGTGTGLTARSMNDAGGAETHQLSVAELASHSHTDIGHAHTEITALPNVTTIGAGAPQATALPGAGITGVGAANLSNTGNDNAHNNMQPFTALKYVVIAK